MTRRRQEQRHAPRPSTPLSVLSEAQMREAHFRVLPVDVWDATKGRWPRWAGQSPPASFWAWENVPDELRARHPDRPAGPPLSEDEELLAKARRFVARRHERERWLAGHGGDWRALLDASHESTDDKEMT